MRTDKAGRKITVRLVVGAVGWVLLGLPMAAQRPALVAEVMRPKLRSTAQVETPEPGAEPGQNGGVSHGQVKDELFAGTERFAKGASEVAEVNMDPDALGMVKGDEAKRARGMVLNVVRSYKYDQPGMYNPAEVEEYRRRVAGGDWHCSVHVLNVKKGESTDICERRRSPDMVEKAIIAVKPMELTFIHTITRADAGGSSVGSGAWPGMFGESPLGTQMAMLEPEMEAQMALAQAEWQARRAEMGEVMGDLKLDAPLPRGPEFQKRIQDLQDQVRRMQERMKPMPQTPQQP